MTALMKPTRSGQLLKPCRSEAGLMMWVGTSRNFAPFFEKIRPKDLFKITNPDRSFSKATMKALGEELELYELIEMNAEGEVDDGNVRRYHVVPYN